MLRLRLLAVLDGGGTLEHLLVLVRTLRDPAGGCPWDLEQDLPTFVRYLREEAGELERAVASGDASDVAEEIGDCLWVVAFLLGMAEERGIALPEVRKAVEAKIVRRHPHVFGGERAANVEEASAIYVRVKAEEKARKAEEKARGAEAGVEAARRGAMAERREASRDRS